MDPKFALLVPLWPPVSPWRWPILKKIRSSGENFSYLPIQICQNQVSISSPVHRKNTITFCNIWALFAWKRGRVTNQRVRIKIWQNFVNLYKHFGSNIFQFWSYRSQRTFQENFNWIFKFGCYSWYQAYFFEKKWIRLPHAEFYGESTDNNFKSQQWKSKKLVCLFLIALCHFETNLIK